MKLTIQTPHFEPGKQLLNFAEEHIIKLQYISDRIIEAQACLKLDKSDKKENKICEIKLVVPGNDLFALKQGNTFEDAILQAVSALKHQLERWSITYKEHAKNT
jgi:ribosome-associated translation inhibitor RaiA